MAAASGKDRDQTEANLLRGRFGERAQWLVSTVLTPGNKTTLQV